MTGGFRLGELPAWRQGFCLFATCQWGKPRAPIYRGNAEVKTLP
ncbi:MAG: hypothetical protein R6T98_14650 [Desulfatiglandales bacterium]